MKKILLTGYFGFKNAGDELILESIINSIRKELPGAEILVLSAMPAETAAGYAVKSVNRWNPLRVLGSIIWCDLLISAGGLYQDATGVLSLVYYITLLCAAKMFKKKAMLYGVDLTPIKKGISKAALKVFLPLADRIGVRSQGSFKLLEDLKIPGNAKLTADAVLILNPRLNGRVEKTDIRKIALIPKRCANVHDCVEICSALAGRFNAEILFVPFHLERDFAFAKEIAARMNFPSTIVRWNIPADLFDILNGADFIVSQRLHGIIIGTMLGIPLLGISNDDKLEFFSRETGQKFLKMSDAESSIVAGIVNDVWQWRSEFRKLAENKLPELKYRSYLNVKLMMEILS